MVLDEDQELIFCQIQITLLRDRDVEFEHIPRVHTGREGIRRGNGGGGGITVKARSLFCTVMMSMVSSLHVCVQICSLSTLSTRGSVMAIFLMHRMSKPYTFSQKSIFSCLQANQFMKASIATILEACLSAS